MRVLRATRLCGTCMLPASPCAMYSRLLRTHPGGQVHVLLSPCSCGLTATTFPLSSCRRCIWPQAVEDIHLEGGTMLGTSEDGECDAMAVVKCLGAMCATCCCSWCRSLLLRPSANAAASGLSSIRLQIQC